MANKRRSNVVEENRPGRNLQNPSMGPKKDLKKKKKKKKTKKHSTKQKIMVDSETVDMDHPGDRVNGIPCIHAAKVILGLKKKLSEYVADCYTTIRWRETYSFGIKPMNGIMEWPQTNRLGVIPPPNRTGKPGRRKNHDRMKSKYETSSKTKLSRANGIVTCSNCKEEGHNKTTCSNQTVEIPPKKPRGRPKKNQGLQFDASQFSFPQDQPSQAQSSQAQSSHSSRWDQSSQYQASQASEWGHWFS